MKYLFILLLSFFTNSVLSQVLTINSKSFNQERKIRIQLPENYKESPASYPVIYLLDGQILFNFLIGLYEYNGDKYPPAIIVGIEQMDRNYELVEQNKTDDVNRDMHYHFSEFFLNELIPFIDSVYRTNSLNIFIGHSFGGQFLLNKMVQHSKINNCICISPTVWFNDYNILNEFQNYSPEKNVNYKLYIGYGDNDFPAIQKGIVNLSKVIKSKSDRNFVLYSDIYINEDHNSSILIGMRKGLNTMFKDFILPENEWDIIDKTGDDSVFYKHFEHLSESFNCEILPNEEDINQLGYFYLERGRIEEAKKNLLKNVNLHPYSSNAYDSYGEALVVSGDLKNALKYFREAYKMEKEGNNNKFQLMQYQDHIDATKKLLKINNTKE